MMVFPAAKLFSVFLRQLSKPMASYLQKVAKDNLYFRGACVGMATKYHTVEQRIINRFYDRELSLDSIPKLDEDRAIEQGATVIGEIFIFSVAATALAYEYGRSSLKEAAREKALQERLMMLEAQIVQLQTENDMLMNKVFPGKKHIRKGIIVDFSPEGWLSWVSSPIKKLFTSESDVENDTENDTNVSKSADTTKPHDIQNNISHANEHSVKKDESKNEPVKHMIERNNGKNDTTETKMP